MHRILVLLSVFCFTSTSQATSIISGIGGNSSSTVVNPTTTPATPTPGTPATPTPTPGTPPTSTTGNTTSATVYGGTGGKACTNPINTQTCDSCAQNLTTTCQNTATTEEFPLCQCNQQRIYDTLVVTISVTRSNANALGLVHIGAVTAGGTAGPDLPGSVPAQNGVSFTWGQICNVMTNGTGASCESRPTQSVILNLYVDNDNTSTYTTGDDLIPITFNLVAPNNDESVYGEANAEGIGAFKAFPGDERIYITAINTATTFPAASGEASTFTNAKILISSDSMSKANVAQAENSSLMPISGAEPTNTYIDGVTNGKPYFVRLAMLDQANNILQYFPTQGTALPANCTSPSVDSADCPYYVIPDQVLGLLSKDVNCFIATAAYGSTLEPKIQTFRDFRQQILLPSHLGKNFVLAYYKYGPYAARFIADKPVIRAMTRGFLWPIYGFSWSSLHYGFMNTLIFSMILLTTLLVLPWYGLRRYQLRE